MPDMPACLFLHCNPQRSEIGGEVRAGIAHSQQFDVAEARARKYLESRRMTDEYKPAPEKPE